MNIMNRVTWKSMWRNPTRTLVTIIGVILSAAMFTAVTTMVFSIWQYFVRDAVYDYGNYFVQYDYASDADIEAIRREKAVKSLAQYDALGFLVTSDKHSGPLSSWIVAAADEAFFETMPVRLEAGRLPENSGEILIPSEALDILEHYGMDTDIGATVTLELTGNYTFYGDWMAHLAVDKDFTKTYTVVGHINGHHYNDTELGLHSILTLADGNQGEALWHRAFIQSTVSDAQALHELPYGEKCDLNFNLIGYYGLTGYSNFNQLIGAMAAVLCAIIMTGSVSLIYNAFSISVAERTRQFGLLTSVGATRKQLRSMVRFEAFSLWAMGIVPGLLAGYGGIYVTLALLRPRIDASFSVGGGTITLEAIPNPWALLASAAITLVTVLISAAIPAKRAAAVDPITAIRQQKDYAVPKKAVKAGKLSSKLFGLPGLLARKYYRTSRKKYRATVISLAISIVLFISAASFSQALQATVENAVRYENFDMRCEASREDLALLRQQEFVTDAAYMAYDNYNAYLPDDQLSREYLDAWEELRNYYDGYSINVPNIYIYYLEDAVLEDYLKQQGIPAEDYLDAEAPTALVLEKRISTYYVQDEYGSWNRYTYRYAPFSENAELLLFPHSVPEILIQGMPRGYSTGYSEDAAGHLQLEIIPMVEWSEDIYGPDEENIQYYRMEITAMEDGNTRILYYTEGSTAPVAEQLHQVPAFRLGETVDEVPFGIPSNAVDSFYELALVLPMSAAPEDIQQWAQLYFNVSDYLAAKAYLGTHFDNYYDLRASEEDNRTLLLLINVFSYGFIVLISLICVANVFNTLSTNIGLRRRDFGMLRSTGFRQKDLFTMMCYECLTYGFKAVILGFPVSLGVSYLIYCIDKTVFNSTYTPPWGAMVVAAASVFLVVFATMYYAVSKLRKDNPIDAIRMENA